MSLRTNVLGIRELMSKGTNVRGNQCPIFRHLHCYIAWDCPLFPWIVLLASFVTIVLVSLSARVTSGKSTKGLLVSYTRSPGPIDQNPCTHGSDKKILTEILFAYIYFLVLL